MKIAFLISSINSQSKGNGGHYHTLATIYKELVKYSDIFIINIGTGVSMTFEKENLKVYNVISDNFNYTENKKKIAKIFDSEKPNVIHSYDHFALFWARRMADKFKLPFCVTKCGGSNPKVFYPYCKNIVLFSNENYIYFNNNKKFIDSNLFLIPNRVVEFSTSQERIKQLEAKIPIEKFDIKILRICRIGNAYKNSLLQTINLLNQLTGDGFSCCLIVIGAIENEDIFNDIKGNAAENIFFVTEDNYIKNAKELIGIADIVLGTGRSFMEASSKGKIMMAPIKNSNIPLLITQENIEKVMNYNFSERFTLDTYSEDENYAMIKAVFMQDQKRKEYSHFARLIFDKYFNVNNVIEKYLSLYKNIERENENYTDLFFHYLYMLKQYKFKI
jgi:hypothetical protein